MKDIKLMSASVCPLAYGFLLDFFQVTDVYSISVDFSFEFICPRTSSQECPES